MDVHVARSLDSSPGIGSPSPALSTTSSTVPPLTVTVTGSSGRTFVASSAGVMLMTARGAAVVDELLASPTGIWSQMCSTG